MDITVRPRPRFAMVRAFDHNSAYSLYDIVDNIDGGERILAERVRFDPADEIVKALNRSPTDPTVG